VEPPLDAAIERVVVAALVMRLVRLAHDRLGRRAKRRETAPAIAPAIGHKGVDAKVVPARGKAVPIGEAVLLEEFPHRRRAQKRKAVAPDRLGEGAELVGHHTILAQIASLEWPPLLPHDAAWLLEERVRR